MSRDVRSSGARLGQQRGFIAIEWVAAIAMLLLPAVVLVATLPTWAERRHAASVAAWAWVPVGVPVLEIL